MRKLGPSFLSALGLIALASTVVAQTPTPIDRTTALDARLDPGAVHSYALRLDRGGSAEIFIKQNGIDVLIDLVDPTGKPIETIDSPTGRNGNEIFEIVAADPGTYVLRVRPDLNQAPGNGYRLEVRASRNAKETAAVMRTRREARAAAAAWLRPRSAPMPANGIIADRARLPLLDQLAARVRVIGLGEATHGSREFGDLRLSLTKYLIERHKYRVVAIEASADVLHQLEPYVNGAADREPDLGKMWIGIRTRGELVRWVREWNRSHPGDRVRVVGVDPQENPTSVRTAREFMAAAYGADWLFNWAPAEREFIAADEQTLVFGDSGISPATRRLIFAVLENLKSESATLVAQFGSKAYDEALEAARRLAEFADFNSSDGGRSRDSYMAERVMRALTDAGPNSKTVYWAHNAHVVHPPGSDSTAGASLRKSLGCEYAALAVTFGEGGFVAQLPNDPEDRLLASELPAARDESVESVLKELGSTGVLSTWPCIAGNPAADTSIPAWLTRSQPMHWIGGLYIPGTPRNLTYRSFDLLRDFDGVIYLPRVTADEIPKDRPLIPARKR